MELGLGQSTIGSFLNNSSFQGGSPNRGAAWFVRSRGPPIRITTGRSDGQVYLTPERRKRSQSPLAAPPYDYHFILMTIKNLQLPLRIEIEIGNDLGRVSRTTADVEWFSQLFLNDNPIANC